MFTDAFFSNPSRFRLGPVLFGPGCVWAWAHLGQARLGPGRLGPRPSWAQVSLDPGVFGPNPFGPGLFGLHRRQKISQNLQNMHSFSQYIRLYIHLPQVKPISYTVKAVNYTMKPLSYTLKHINYNKLYNEALKLYSEVHIYIYIYV